MGAVKADQRHGAVIPPPDPELPCPPVVDESIFKAYDVRGIHPDQMDEELAYHIGRAFARVLCQLQDIRVSDLRVGVGRDMRLTAPAMTEAYVRGIAGEGAAVLDVGMVGTEMLYWTVGSRD